PLLLFVPQLVLAHHLGLADIGAVATELGRRFRIRCFGGHERELSAEPGQIEEMTAMGVTFREEGDRLPPLLFDKGDILYPLAVTLLPTVPMMLVSIPLSDWMALAGAFTGGARL